MRPDPDQEGSADAVHLTRCETIALRAAFKRFCDQPALVLLQASRETADLAAWCHPPSTPSCLATSSKSPHGPADRWARR